MKLYGGVVECNNCTDFIPMLKNQHYKFCPYCGMELLVRQPEPYDDKDDKLYIVRHHIHVDIPYYGSNCKEDIRDIFSGQNGYGSAPENAAQKLIEKFGRDYELIEIDTTYKLKRHRIGNIIPYMVKRKKETCDEIALRKLETGIWKE